MWGAWLLPRRPSRESQDPWRRPVDYRHLYDRTVHERGPVGERGANSLPPWPGLRPVTDLCTAGGHCSGGARNTYSSGFAAITSIVVSRRHSRSVATDLGLAMYRLASWMPARDTAQPCEQIDFNSVMRLLVLR